MDNHLPVNRSLQSIDVIHYERRASLRDFLYFLFKHKTQIILFFLATVSAVTLGTFLKAPTYEASSRILVKIGRENLYVPMAASGGNSNPVVTVSQEAQINSEIEILKSRALAEEVVRTMTPEAIYPALAREERGLLGGILPRRGARLSPSDKAVLKLQKDLAVEVVKKSSVIQVLYKHNDREVAASVVNSLVHLYLDRHLEVYKNPESHTFFEEQSRLLKNKLTGVEEELKAFKENHDLSSLQEQRTLLLQEESGLRTGLNQTESAITETQDRLKQLRQQIATVPKNIPKEEAADHNPYLINSLQAKLVDLELREKELATKYTDKSRLVRNVRDEIALVRGRLDQLEGKRYDSSSSGVNPTYQRLEEEFLRNDAELKALAAKQKAATAKHAWYQLQLENLNRVETRLDQLTRDVDVHRQNYRLYLTKFEESRISNAMDIERIANVSLIDTASPPLAPVSPKVMINLALGVILGGFGALALAFATEYLDDSLERPEQAQRALALPVLASVPQLK